MDHGHASRWGTALVAALVLLTLALPSASTAGTPTFDDGDGQWASGRVLVGFRHEISPERVKRVLAEEDIGARDAVVDPLPIVPDAFIVRLKPQSGPGV